MKAIINMAHSLKLRIVAEGVETDAQLKFTRARHCNVAQGFYPGKPMSGREFSSLLASSAVGSTQDPSRTQP